MAGDGRGVDPTRDDLAELASKYETLAEMRRREIDGHPPREDALYRAIARRFPGALKELDQLELAEIDGRRAALLDATLTGEVALWMRLVHVYHGFLRGALRAKLAVRAKKRGDDGADTSSTALARVASKEAGFTIAESEIEELFAEGRCLLIRSAVVFVSSRTGASMADVRAALALRTPRA